MKFNENVVDVAYELVKKNMDIKSFDFNELISLVCDYFHVNKKQFIEENVGDFYTELLLDVRFVFLGKDKWCLKESLNLKDYKDKINALYDFSTKEYLEEEYENMIVENQTNKSNSKTDLIYNEFDEELVDDINNDDYVDELDLSDSEDSLTEDDDEDADYLRDDNE